MSAPAAGLPDHITPRRVVIVGGGFAGLFAARHTYFPFGQEIIVAGSGRLGIEITDAVAHVVVAEFLIDE